MKKLIKKQLLTITTFATLACFSLATITVAMAKGNSHTSPMRAFSQLDLSNQQKLEMRAIFKTTRENNSVFEAEKSAMRQQMESLMSLPSWDEATARSILTSQVEQGKTIALNRAKARNETFNLLDDEQQATLSEKYANKENDGVKNKDRKKDKRKGKKMSMKRLSKALSLDADQIAQIKAIDAATKAQMKVMKEAREPIRSQMRALTQASTFDDGAWLALHEASINDMVEHRLVRVKARYDKAAVLSVEQQSKMLEIMEKRKGKRGQGRKMS